MEDMMTSRFESKVVLITGATSGVGAAVAHRVAAEGAAVVLGARGREAGDRIAEQIRAAGGRAVFVPTDVTVAEEVARLTEAAMHEFGRLD
ncbi:SDR family NAD(P)-dependent oxidoreductase, partial [Nocardia gipuzkoensis]